MEGLLAGLQCSEGPPIVGDAALVHRGDTAPQATMVQEAAYQDGPHGQGRQATHQPGQLGGWQGDNNPLYSCDYVPKVAVEKGLEAGCLRLHRTFLATMLLDFLLAMFVICPLITCCWYGTKAI